MAYIKRGRPAGRPKTYHSDAEKPRHLSIRVPAALFARLEATAAEQRSCVTHVTAQALQAHLDAHQTPGLAGLSADLTRALEALADLEATLLQTLTPQQDAVLKPRFDVVFERFLDLGDALRRQRDATPHTQGVCL